MTSSLITSYLGHKIEIQPLEGAYVAQVLAPASPPRFTSAHTSAFAALEDAFDIVDRARKRHIGPAAPNNSPIREIAGHV